MAGETTVEPDWSSVIDCDGEDSGVCTSGSLEATTPEGSGIDWSTGLGKAGLGDGVGLWVEVELDGIANCSSEGVRGELESILADSDLVGHNTGSGGKACCGGRGGGGSVCGSGIAVAVICGSEGEGQWEKDCGELHDDGDWVVVGR